MDHRPAAAGASGLPPVPAALPEPGIGSTNALWKQGRVEFEAPDTSHLPSGGPGGRLVISAHVLPRTSDGQAAMATVITFPDGYRLGSLWPAADASNSAPWHEWMSGPDGLGHAFTTSATAWSVAQRAWPVRAFYDFMAATPDGVTLSAMDWETAKRAITRGMLAEQGPRLAKMDPSHVTALQQAGFWLPDAEQTNWLGAGDTPFATTLKDAPSASAASERLYDMYVSGWTVEAYRNWSPAQPVADARVRLREFHVATLEWDTTIAAACALMRTKATGKPVDATGGTQVPVRTGEIASLCLSLGLTPFHVGVMVGEGSFSVEALRTMVALRHPVAS